MYWDRFDIVEAWYLALTHCHAGQYSDSYARLCHMQSYFTPGMGFGEDTLTENGKEIYEQACAVLLKVKNLPQEDLDHG